MSKELSSIIIQYNSLLTRFARRLLTEPHYADNVISEIFGDMYDQNKLYSGPHLRKALKAATIGRCTAYNKLIEFHNKLEKDKLHMGGK